MLMAFLSLLCSFLLFLTGWLMVPFFVFGPLSIYFGWKSYKQSRARMHGGTGMRLLALMPMFIAIVAIPGTLIFIQATYKA